MRTDSGGTGFPRAARAAAVAVAALGAVLAAGAAGAADKVTFGTNWKAQAEHGGFYQALATGLYEAADLDVTIRQGGPQVNHSQLLAAGRVDFNMGGSLFSQFAYTEQKVPLVTVAAIFQKEPQVLLAHPDAGVDGFDDLSGKTILVGNDGRAQFWNWLRQVYGLKDEQLRPYTFNPAPFLADKNSVQQGYVTSEPYAIREVGGIEPVVLMMADAGYDTYSTTIETSWKLVEERPDVVRRFVDATILGWNSYLYGDPAPGNALIKGDNPEMTDGQIAFSIAALKRYGIADSGDALTQGIGAMSDARWRSFHAKTVEWGLFPADLPLDRMYTLAFVNKGHGLDLKKELAGR